MSTIAQRQPERATAGGASQRGNQPACSRSSRQKREPCGVSADERLALYRCERPRSRPQVYGTTLIVITPVTPELSFLICVVPTMAAINFGVELFGVLRIFLSNPYNR